MQANPNDFPELVTESLEDRILNMVEGFPTFNFKVVKKLFPEEGDRAIYRALNSLQESGRIKQMFWANRMKHYSTMGTSKLPMISGAEGEVISLGQFFPHIPSRYIGNHWQRIAAVNELPIDFGRLFYIANELTGKDQKNAYIDMIYKLQTTREVLMQLVSWIDAVLKHPTMKGDLDLFVEIFTSKESPSPQQLTDFKVWHSRTFPAKEINNEGSEDTQS